MQGEIQRGLKLFQYYTTSITHEDIRLILFIVFITVTVITSTLFKG